MDESKRAYAKIVNTTTMAANMTITEEARTSPKSDITNNEMNSANIMKTAL